ncbi:MAG: O-antigen ligase family protein [Acidobacteria bacterium]|nr:O-antigen ligase family protein [Acidobacteriota bacterium]
MLDSLGIDPGPSRLSRLGARLLTLFVLLFGIALPHSIAGAHITLNLALLAWIFRDLTSLKLRFARTRLDYPLIAFAALTILSTIFSVEPRVSAPKLLSLLLFGVVYLLATNLTARGVQVFVALLLLSLLAGVIYSFGEKIIGRGVTLTAIAGRGPLGSSKLQTGDVIWMVDRRRVASLDDIAEIVRQTPSGRSIEIEALHEGDPLPVTLEITEEMKALSNPLEITVGGRSRRFRISGFTRHFITYADQMQIAGLLSFGFLLASFGNRRRAILWGSLSAVFALALMLTASRAAAAAYLAAMVLTAALAAGRRAFLGVLAATILLGAMAVPILLATRTATTARLVDDSASRRFGYMQAGLRVIPRHPVFGVGMDSHKLHWNEWGFPGEYVTHTHSTPIQIAMERGLPALGAWIWLLAAMIAVARRACRGASDPWESGLGLGVTAALVGFTIGSLVNYNFGDAEVLLLVLALVGCVVGRR